MWDWRLYSSTLGLLKNSQERRNRGIQNGLPEETVQIVSNWFGNYTHRRFITSYWWSRLQWQSYLWRHLLWRVPGIALSAFVTQRLWERARSDSCTVRALGLVRPGSLSAAQEVLARNRHPDPEVRRGRRREGSRRVSRTFIACRKRQVDRWRNNWPLISRANLKESERDGERRRERGRELKLAQLYRWVRGGLRRNYK